MKLKSLLLITYSLLLMCSCGTQKPITTTHVERIEERLQPVAVGADTIEITEYRLQITDYREQKLTPCSLFHVPYSLLPAPHSLKSTRGVNIFRTETDTTKTLRITLRPDTVYLPYTTYIRSDTIVIQDKICKQKLTQSKTMNIFLLITLILLVATIIYKKISR